MPLKFNTLKVFKSQKKELISVNSIDTETSKFFTNSQEIEKYSISSELLNSIKQKECIVNEEDFNSKKSNFDDSISSESDDKTPIWYPDNWKKQLSNIKEMRNKKTAPVDIMGCQKCVDQSATGSVYRFQLLCALILSSQTKDQITYAAMQRLINIQCTPNVIASITDEHLGKLIYPVSFWKRKIQYIKKTAIIIVQKYNGDIPNNVKELCTLPGVGPKIAYICMQIAWNKVLGIGVDTHVHRICNRLKWVPKPTKSPEETRIILESWLPKEHWVDVNCLLVGFGQEICQPRRPKCSECSNNFICSYVDKKYEF